MTDEHKTQEQIDDETYTTKEYTKKVYSISGDEMAELQPLENAIKLVQTFLALGQIAQRAKDNYVAINVLKRVGIKESPDTKFNYDIATGKVIVYEPKFWCSTCGNKRAEYKFEEKPYCKDCIEVLRNKAVEKLEVEKSKEKPNKARKK